MPFKTESLLPFKNSEFMHVGRDEKGCKMDVDGLEKSSQVNVDQEKCSGININCQRSTYLNKYLYQKYLKKSKYWKIE